MHRRLSEIDNQQAVNAMRAEAAVSAVMSTLNSTPNNGQPFFSISLMDGADYATKQDLESLKQALCEVPSHLDVQRRIQAEISKIDAKDKMDEEDVGQRNQQARATRFTSTQRLSPV